MMCREFEIGANGNVPLPRKCRYRASAATAQVPLPRKCRYRASAAPAQVPLPRKCRYRASAATRKYNYHTNAVKQSAKLEHLRYYYYGTHPADNISNIRVESKLFYKLSYVTRIWLKYLKAIFHTTAQACRSKQTNSLSHGSVVTKQLIMFELYEIG
jgi:hypothetical protein